MSKSKNEIIAANTKTAFDTTWTDYDKAMDEYAAQVLSEYKEKLKAEIRCIVASEGNGKYTLNKALSIIEQP